MGGIDDAALANQRLWEAEVEKGCGFTIPWLDLNLALLRRYAAGDITNPPAPLDCISPAGVLAEVEGKDVLCLASGGGQQSAVFGLLGAKVTVVDLTEGQLEGDRRAAAHYAYNVTTIQSDMRDLSALGDDAFDLVFQADSMAYIPDVRQVYREVARVLRHDGIYRVKHRQPAVFTVSVVDETYRIATPYAERVEHREDGGIEFRHYMDDIFNGLVEAGLELIEVIDLGRNRQPGADAEPGSWCHEESYVGGGFVIMAGRT